MIRLLNLVRLNWNVFRLAYQGQWLSANDISIGYDKAAPSYDTEWLLHLRGVTDQLLAGIPALPQGQILDLGCGTGYTTAYLAEHYPLASIEAIDLSEQMLQQARQKITSSQVIFRQGDMLHILENKASLSHAAIVSAWSLGYSKPGRIIKESGRILQPGGILAFVVNRLDTLGPVFQIFRDCMVRYPDQVNRALWPSFPKGWSHLEPLCRRARLQPLWWDENKISLRLPESNPLAWILKTGILAGFDSVLPLRENQPVAEYFNHRLQTITAPPAHHYLAAICRKEN